MNRLKRYLFPVALLLMLGLLTGGDCEIDIDGWGPRFWGYGPYYDYVVVEEVWYDPFFPW